MACVLVMEPFDWRWMFSTLFMNSFRSTSTPLIVAMAESAAELDPKLVKISPITNENNASAITIIKKIDRCLILFNTAMKLLSKNLKYSGRNYQFNLN